ncbi:MAG: HD domain-containing protein [Candidatus Margulisiibacteriota bacterium]
MPISTKLWGITQAFPGKESVPLFEALEACVAPTNAVSHTAQVVQSLRRVSVSTDPATAQRLFRKQGLAGQQNSTLIVELCNILQSLSPNDKKVLMIAAVLHDMGKATGKLEKHPEVGLDLFRKSPAIAQEIRKILSPTHTDAEIKEAFLLIETVIRDHDLISGLGITRDRNIFEAAEAITKMSKSQATRQKILDFLLLVNFADIDGRSEKGLFTDEKLKSFYDIYEISRELLEDETSENNYAWWGAKRVLAWARGDTPKWNDQEVFVLVNKLFPTEAERTELFDPAGKLKYFDQMYNFATVINDPLSALIFIDTMLTFAKIDDIDAIILEASFLTDPKIAEAVRSSIQKEEDSPQPEEDIERLFNMDISEESDGTRILKLSYPRRQSVYPPPTRRTP